MTCCCRGEMVSATLVNNFAMRRNPTAPDNRLPLRCLLQACRTCRSRVPQSSPLTVPTRETKTNPRRSRLIWVAWTKRRTVIQRARPTTWSPTQATEVQPVKCEWLKIRQRWRNRRSGPTSGTRSERIITRKVSHQRPKLKRIRH